VKARKKLILISFLLLIAFCSTAFAYMFKQTDYKENAFIPVQVSCEVKEVTNNDISEKSEIKVKNTSNISVYIRLHLVSYWSNNEDIISKSSPIISFKLSDNWIKSSDNTYYYRTAVMPSDLTSNLLAEGSVIELQEDNEGNKQVIEVFAEAIQSKPQKAVINSWKITLDNDGYIASAP